MKELKIVIAEDSEVFSKLLSRTLSVIVGFKVVGTAANGVRAIELTRELKPDVLVLDITMPFKDGIEVLKEIRAEDSSTVIVMFTADTSPPTRRICLEAGADYFLNKSQILELLEICNLQLLAL
ncbi:MAG TPA: response regulator transcription factor [Pyrinomonadaceae bacterium]